ncbi:MAG: DNA mismatch repair endonuclease MutL, partial [Chloroflexi bacterium]|nr:DNA mismatch repair endonuclease MutL [Chloroflexota bacterium]
MAIGVLSPEIVARIAAGEVVERPVSVVKELIENSLDAGATRIEIEVQAGGIGMIRVVDDGAGIAKEDVPAAFQRHATSKLHTVEDMDRIQTLGFRGEALASIAAVSDVSMVSRVADATGGWAIRVSNGRVIEQGPRGAPHGTSTTVRNIFSEVPARLKFLRSNASEAGRITTLVGHYALAYPEVGFMLAIDGRRTFASQGAGDQRDPLARLYGLETGEAALEVAHEEDAGAVPIVVRGLISPPRVTRANRSYITLFVNRRLIQSRTLTFAVLDAYRGLLMTGRYPIAVLNIDIDAAETDVNVHPAKAEVRFRDEGIVFSAIHHAVKGALADATLARPLHSGLSAPNASGLAVPNVGSLSVPNASRLSVPNAGRLSVPNKGTGNGASLFTPGDSPMTPVAPRHTAGAPSDGPQPVQAGLGLPVLRVLGQLRGTFIVAEGPEGMYLLDQHTAHERVLFDELRRKKAAGHVQSQGLLEPVAVELSPQQEELFEEHRQALEAYGFSLERFGERTALLRAVPALLSGKSPAQALRDVLDYAGTDDLRGYDWEDRILATVACHGAVRAGHDLQVQVVRGSDVHNVN